MDYDKDIALLHTCALLALGYLSSCFTVSKTSVAGDAAQPDSQPDHTPGMVLRLRQGGVPGA